MPTISRALARPPRYRVELVSLITLASTRQEDKQSPFSAFEDIRRIQCLSFVDRLKWDRDKAGPPPEYARSREEHPHIRYEKRA